MTNELPTRIGDIEPWLRSLAIPRDLETGAAYAYLFGMATVKLAEAHTELAAASAEIARLRAQRDAALDGIADSMK